MLKKVNFYPWEIENVIVKITEEGNENILITERGTQFGYNNLVVDMRSIHYARVWISCYI